MLSSLKRKNEKKKHSPSISYIYSLFALVYIFHI